MSEAIPKCEQAELFPPPDLQPIIIRRGEEMAVKEAEFRAGMRRKAVIALVRRHAIFRQPTSRAPIVIHRAAFEMALAGDATAIKLLRQDRRDDPRVARYYDLVGLPI
ncbi:hypothetical protein [Brucella pituitosa]|uniref:hypothetical protein n=1 Tax=Brucella pituitosa TaxID=571256 RepID=UPI000C27B371|nr:hypothetical protein [Brucella pituitosa]PJO47192.1 hypothetical protein CWE02_19200 [Brucella pituitosa]